MKLPRRQFLHLAAGTAALPAVSRIARAQTYPTRPVQLIVGFFGGGAPDILARLVGQWLSERLGQPFIIETRPGAGSNIAAEAVVRAPPDGHTLLMATTANAVNATFFENLKFNFVRDIAPVASVGTTPFVLAAHPSLPSKSIPEFIAYAKANPRRINMASPGIGSVSHVAGELFKMMTTVDLVHVPYRSSYMSDLLSGQVQVALPTVALTIEYVRTGKLRALAVTTATRSAALPDVLAVGEFVPGYEATGWSGIGAPKNTPTDIVDKLNREINAGLADPKMKARFADLGYAPYAGTPSDFGKFIADETEKWGKVVKAAKIKPE